MAVELLLTVHMGEWSPGSGTNRLWRLGPLRGSSCPREGDLFFPWVGDPELELEVVRVDWSWMSTAPDLLASVLLQEVVLNPTDQAWVDISALRGQGSFSGRRRVEPTLWTDDPGAAGVDTLFGRLHDEGWEERR